MGRASSLVPTPDVPAAIRRSIFRSLRLRVTTEISRGRGLTRDQ
jgi:hypothetical protein